MDLNKLQLSEPVLAGIYKNLLVDLSNADRLSLPQVEAETKTTWKHLGDNKKNILIIVNHNEATHLPDEQLSFLTTILDACKISLGDVAIVNLSHHSQYDYKEITSHFKSKITLLFAVEPQVLNMPVQFPPFQVQLFDKCAYLLSSSLEELQNDKVLKSKLWVCLQRIFTN